MLELGLRFVIDQQDMSIVQTTVYVPSHIDACIFMQELRERSIFVYEGKGCFKNSVFQVSNIGELSFDDIRFFLDSLQEILLRFTRTDSPVALSMPVN